MSRLITMLLHAGALTAERAKEARGHQVVFGDRIGTNLLALGYLNELTLAQALGALHNMPFAAGTYADSKPVLTRTLPRQTAARLSVVPGRADDVDVYVFCVDPLPSAAVDELQAHFRRRVHGVLVVEARMWALLHKFYLVKRGMRAIRLDDDDAKRTTIKPRSAERAASSVATAISLLDGAGPSTSTLPALTAPSTLPSSASTLPSSSTMSLPPERAVDTSWLSAALPAPAPVRPPMARPAPAPAPTPAPTSWLPTTAPPTTPSTSTPSTLPTQAPLPVVAPATSLPVSARPDEQVRFDALVAEELPLVPVVELLPEAAIVDTVAPVTLSTRPVFAEADIPFDELIEDALVEEAVVMGDLVDDVPAEDVSPLDFNAARAALSGVDDRKTISRIVLRYARSRVRRALLLTVQGKKGGEEAFGWDALGDGLRPGLIHDIRLSLSEPSALQLARESRAHVLGPLAKTAINDELVDLMGGAPPKTAFVMPILARGRVVNLLYLDNGPNRFMEPDIGELLILAQHINKSYDTLLKTLVS
jgi:hypothetical protein